MAGQQIRAVVVDDSRLMRSMISAALQAEGDIQCVGVAQDVQEARQLIKTVNPDVITLDVEMPGMNGLEFLGKIMTLRPMPVVMVSSLTQSGTEVTLAALEAGAVDAVAKPMGKGAATTFARRLREAVRAGARATVRRQTTPTRAAPTTLAGQSGPLALPLIAIGASTGGVAAIGELFSHLAPNLPPIVITQHMPPGYTERFASRLNSQLPFSVQEAQDGETLRPNMVRIAPGDRHLRVEDAGGMVRTCLDDQGAVSGHKPSVDVLFQSVAEQFRGRAVGAIMTGMGRDGAAGLLAMRKAGAPTLGQNQQSCVVYGMPKVAHQMGAVAEEVDINRMATRVMEIVTNGGAQSARRSHLG